GSLGFERVIVAEAVINYVVHRQSVEYRKPALLDDRLYVTAQDVERGQTFLRFHQKVWLEPSVELLLSAEVKIACVDQALRPRRLTAALIEAMGSQQPAGQA